MSPVDLENRDANDVNAHITVQFEDLLAEPPGVRSSNCVWSLSHTCFNCWKGCWYKIFSLLCGCCISIYWGLLFGNVAFSHVWCITPCFRCMEMNCQSVRKVVRMCLSCCLDPICESCGMIFHAFRRSDS